VSGSSSHLPSLLPLQQASGLPLQQASGLPLQQASDLTESFVLPAVNWYLTFFRAGEGGGGEEEE